jgi:hypothetical protein
MQSFAHLIDNDAHRAPLQAGLRSLLSARKRKPDTPRNALRIVKGRQECLHHGKLTCTLAKALGAVTGGAGFWTVTRSHWAPMEVRVCVPVIATKSPKVVEH